MSRLNPLTLFLWFIAVTVVVFQLEKLPSLGLLFTLQLVLVMWTFRASSKRFLWFTPLLLTIPTTLLTFALAYWSSGMPWAGAWSKGVDEGMLYSLRIFNVILANILFIGISDQSTLLGYLSRLRIPENLLILLFGIINFFPVLVKEAGRIIEIQRCRGISPRHMITRHHLLPVAVPLIMVILQRAGEMAVTIRLRGIFAGGEFRKPGIRDVFAGLGAATLLTGLYLI